MCKKNWYDQPTTSAGAIIINDKSQILFGVRAYDPWKGKMGILGGFLDNGESLEDGCKREIYEETGIRVEELEYFGSYPDVYEYKNHVYNATVAIFITRVSDLIMQPDVNEVQKLVWVDLDKIELKNIQGGGVNIAIKDYLESVGARHH